MYHVYHYYASTFVIMKTLLIKFVVLLAMVMVSASLYSLSDGGFNATGAPGEGDCTGCHTGGTINSDPNGSMIIEIDSSNGFYMPGKTYSGRVKLTYPGKNRFGFVLTTRIANSPLHIGTFSTSDTFKVFNQLTHISHRRRGIDNPNENIFTFSWTAPDTFTQDISFYTSGVIADGDDTNTGDKVYTASKTLKRLGGGTALPFIKIPNNIALAFPIPIKDLVNIDGITWTENISAELIKSNGEQVNIFNHNDIKPAQNGIQIFLKYNYAPGIYYLIIKDKFQPFQIKVVIN